MNKAVPLTKTTLPHHIAVSQQPALNYLKCVILLNEAYYSAAVMFPLMTCAPKWVIRRYQGCDWMDMEIGRCLQLHYSAQEQDFANQLTAELNTAPQFDFDYTPAEGDVINIETVSSGRKNIIELQFSAGQWQQQRQNSSHLNRNLEIGSGVLVQR